MEDHFDKLLYLVVGVIYFFLNNAKSRNTEKQTTPGKTFERQPTPATSTEEAPVKKPLLQTPIKKVSSRPVHSTTTQMTAQQRSDEKIDRILRRYSGWKKAIIIGELIQPRS